MDWSEQPVLTSIETYTYPVEEVQFPTITICPSRYVGILGLEWSLVKYYASHWNLNG